MPSLDCDRRLNRECNARESFWYLSRNVAIVSCVERLEHCKTLVHFFGSRVRDNPHVVFLQNDPLEVAECVCPDIRVWYGAPEAYTLRVLSDTGVELPEVFTRMELQSQLSIQVEKDSGF